MPIWLLVFLFSFIPLVGAIASGAIAVLLVLVLNGWVGALIMLAIVLAVQQIEGNVLQPFIMGKAVEIHPLGVFLGVALGAMIAGIPGALFAIPLIAFVNATLLYVVGRDPSPELGHDKASAEHFASLGAGVPAHQRAEASSDSEAQRASADEDSSADLAMLGTVPAAERRSATDGGATTRTGATPTGTGGHAADGTDAHDAGGAGSRAADATGTASPEAPSTDQVDGASAQPPAPRHRAEDERD